MHSCLECIKDYIVEVFFSVSKWCVACYHTCSRDHWETYLVVLITSYFEKSSVVATELGFIAVRSFVRS